MPIMCNLGVRHSWNALQGVETGESQEREVGMRGESREWWEGEKQDSTLRDKDDVIGTEQSGEKEI